MFRRKKALLPALALSLSLALTACSNGAAAPTPTPDAPGGTQTGAPAQVDWAKNVEVYVPASAGGGTDIMARTLAGSVSAQSGSNLTIVNNNDGGGAVSFETIRTAQPDGSKIMQFHTSMLIKTASGVYNHRVDEEFTVIGVSRGTEKAGYVLVTAADSGMDTLDAFLAKAQEKPGELLLGVETGGSSHIMAGLMSQAADISIKYVEAGPDTEKLTALVGGSIQACLVNPNQAKQYVEAGKVNALAVISIDEEGARGTVLPDVPSFSELGVDFTFVTQNLILGPKGMDEALARQIYDYYAAAAEDAGVNEVLTPAGFEMRFLPFEDGLAAVTEQQDQLNKVVEDLGLKK